MILGKWLALLGEPLMVTHNGDLLSITDASGWPNGRDDLQPEWFIMPSVSYDMMRFELSIIRVPGVVLLTIDARVTVMLVLNDLDGANYWKPL